MKTTETTTPEAFEVGQTYSTRSACDYDCIFSHEILRRTANSVWIKVHGNVKRRKITNNDGIETIAPFGRYSMSPTYWANKPGVPA